MKLFQKKKDSEFLSVKDLNKRVNELMPLKENQSFNEYNLTIIIKSLINILYNFSRQLNLGNDPKQELNIPLISKYLNQFKQKPYYDKKIFPIIYFLKSHYLLSRQEKAFTTIIKDIKSDIIKVKKINDHQIDNINYILINNFKKLVNLNESCEIFSNLFYIFKELNGKEYNYLYEYYIVILLINMFFSDLEKNSDDQHIIINIITILFIIISEEKNNDISELSFLLFCGLYSKLDNNPFTFSEQSKWILLILKLFKEEICLFKSDPENNNNFYNFIKPFHHKFYLCEIARNKKRSSFYEDTFLAVTSQNITQNIKLPENIEEAQMYLNDKTYEKFPKELHLPKGPSNNLYKYLYNEDFKKKLNKGKKNIILGALQISSIILKTKYHGSDFDFKYYSIKLCNELTKRIMPLYIKDKYIIRICLYCMGSMMSICPEHIIKYIPLVFHAFKDILDKDKYFLNLNHSLDYFLKKCNEIINQAYKKNDRKIINEINEINKSGIFFEDIYSSIIIIFHLPNYKIKKKNEKNTEVNLTSLVNNAFDFISFLVNQYFLVNNYLTFEVEANLLYLIMKYPTLYVTKYMTKIICKIYIEHVLISIYKNLFINEFTKLRHKSLFFVIRLLLVEKMYNYLDFFTKFLQKHITIEISSSSELLEYFVLHISFEKNILYLVNFDKEEEKYKINNENNNLEIFSLTNPNFNINIFNYIIDLMFLCIKDSENLEDIVNINKLVKMIFLNLIPIEEKNIELLLEFLMKYINNINKSIENQGYQKEQNNLRKLFEILYYTNFFINIKENNDKYFKSKNHRIIVRFYHFVIIGTFQLFPDNFNSKEYEFQNILPVIYLYLFIFSNLLEINNEQKEEIKSIIIDITKFIIDSSKNNYNNSNNTKHRFQFNNYNLAIFYIFSLIKNIESKYFLSFISYYLVKFLNVEEFKLDINNAEINALNYILFNNFIQIIMAQESMIKNNVKKSNSISSLLQNKSPFLNHIYNTIKIIFEDINANEKIQINHEEKINFTNENLKFNLKTNFIEFFPNKKERIDNKNENKIITENNNIAMLNKDSKIKSNMTNLNNNYQSWLNYLCKASTIVKSKKHNYEEDIKKHDTLLKSSFSFYSTKIEKNIGLIKSEEIINKDIPLFSSFLSNLGVVTVNENKFVIQKEYLFDKYIIHLDKNDSYDILIVLIKENFEQYEDSILSEKFIIYVKPLILKSVYSIKIKKNSNYKIKNNNNKINNQIDNDINKMFSDFIIIDFNNKTQIDFFYKTIDVLFNYSLLEHFIDTSMNLLNK